MSSLPYPSHGYTMADYRSIERRTGVKYEYHEGEVYAMTGGSPLHARLAAVVLAQFERQLSGSPCQVYTGDLGVRSMVTGLATYADVTVVCGRLETDPEDENTVVNPTVVVEVTSPTSERRDRDGKLAHYQTIESLHAVVIVSHREPVVTLVKRDQLAQKWTPRTYWRDGIVPVRPGLVLDVAALYSGQMLA